MQFVPSKLREAQKQNRRMGIWSGTVTIWATSRARVPRRDPNFSPIRPDFRLGDPAIVRVRVDHTIGVRGKKGERKREEEEGKKNLWRRRRQSVD